MSTAIHEAGHAVIGWFIGAPPHMVAICTDNGEIAGYTNYTGTAPTAPVMAWEDAIEFTKDCSTKLQNLSEPTATNQARKEAERYAMRCLGGVLAVEVQIESYGLQTSTGIERYHIESPTDLVLASLWLMPVMSGRYDDCIARLENRTKRILRHPKIHRAVLALAEELACRGTLHQAEILDIIHGAIDGR